MGPYSTDAALFDTGARNAYVVTGAAVVRSITISYDHVAFHNFQLNNPVSGASFTVAGGGVAFVDATSSLSLLNHDGYGGGPLTVRSGALLVSGRVTSLGGAVGAGGTLSVFGGGTVFIAPPVSFTEAAGGRIAVSSGGTFSASLSTLDGLATVSGSGSRLYVGFGTLAAGGVIEVSHGGTLAGYHTEVAGRVALSDGLVTDTLHITATGSLGGHGTLTTALGNDGVATARGGTLDLAAGASGSGTLAIGPGATLELGANSAETIVFAPFDARLLLDAGVAATGTVRGFAAGDAIDLAGVGVNAVGLTAAGADTILKAYANGKLVGTFDLAGTYAAGEIVARSDGHGGSLLLDVGAGTAAHLPVVPPHYA